ILCSGYNPVFDLLHVRVTLTNWTEEARAISAELATVFFQLRQEHAFLFPRGHGSQSSDEGALASKKRFNVDSRRLRLPRCSIGLPLARQPRPTDFWSACTTVCLPRQIATIGLWRKLCGAATVTLKEDSHPAIQGYHHGEVGIERGH